LPSFGAPLDHATTPSARGGSAAMQRAMADQLHNVAKRPSTLRDGIGVHTGEVVVATSAPSNAQVTPVVGAADDLAPASKGAPSAADLRDRPTLERIRPRRSRRSASRQLKG